METVDQKIAHNKVQCRKTDLWDNCKLIACYKYTKNDVMYDDVRSATLRPPLARGVVKVWHGGRQARILRMARRKQYVILISSDLSGGETQSWNEPSRSLNFHNHEEGPYQVLSLVESGFYPSSRGLLGDCTSNFKLREYSFQALVWKQAGPCPRPGPGHHRL